jgi:hypothetical protein
VTIAPTTPTPGDTTGGGRGPTDLFEEARRRRRRRRLVAILAVALSVLVAVVLLANDGGGGGTRHHGSATGSGDHGAGPGTSAGDRGPTDSIVLPSGYWFNQITSVGPRLLLTGSVPRTGSAWSTRCALAPVDPATLRVGPITVGSCDDPALAGRRVAPVVTYTNDDNDGAIAIAHVDGATGVVSTGPVVMTFANASDTRPVLVYGRGSLWVYDVDTPRGPEVLQVSDSSGAVEATINAPRLYRPLLAANDEGLWLGNSVGGSPAPFALYHIAPGATRANGVVVGNRLSVFWLAADSDHVWAGLGPVFSDQSIWRFDGTGGVGLRARDAGFDPFGLVVGTMADGLWTAVPYPPFGRAASPSSNRSEVVVHIDATTGHEAVVARLSPFPQLTAEDGLTPGEGVVFDGSLYLLRPPFDANGYLGFSRLVRVSP